MLPTFDDVLVAASRLNDQVFRTPILSSSTLNTYKLKGAQCFLKCENFQRSGAFKFRGAFTALSELSEEKKSRGVVAFSSGNHAQAVALSGNILGIKTTIVMPSDAPELKVKATQSYGGNIVFYDRQKEDRVAIGRRLADEHGFTLIHPYDNKWVIAGHGTAAKELFEEVGPLDYLFVCVGGGGLISGSALSTKALSPQCRIFGVEPVAGNDAQMSLQSGSIVKIATPVTIADGAQTQYIGDLTFEIMRTHIEGIITVTDEELVDCMHFFAERMKIIVEPTGCLGLAGLLKLAADPPPGFSLDSNTKVGVIVSGGNVDLIRFGELIKARV